MDYSKWLQSLHVLNVEICICIVREPVSQQCGHLHCKACLAKWHETKLTCPKCRQPRDAIGNVISNPFVANQVYNILLSFSPIFTWYISKNCTDSWFENSVWISPIGLQTRGRYSSTNYSRTRTHSMFASPGHVCWLRNNNRIPPTWLASRDRHLPVVFHQLCSMYDP